MLAWRLLAELCHAAVVGQLLPLQGGRTGLAGAAPAAQGCLQGLSRAGEVPGLGNVCWGLAFPQACRVTCFSPSPAQHDGQPYCHKPCYGILFGPKGECLGAQAPPMLMPLPRGDLSLERATLLPGCSPSCISPCAGVNTGAVGSYIYDKDPEAKNQP